MDADDAPEEPLEKSLGFIRRVNRWLGYTRATIWHLDRLTAGWDSSRPLRVLDVATGSADVPLEVCLWAQRRGVRVDVVGLDRHEKTLDTARRAGAIAAGVRLVRGDALHLPFDAGGFDYVMCSMFLHHLETDAIGVALREMDRVAQRGVIVADLLRNRRAYAWISLFTVAAGAMVRHDARASVRAAMTGDEVKGVQNLAGLSYTRFFRHFGHRFVLAGNKRDNAV